MKVIILGNNSAIPAAGRHPTAQIVEVKEQYFLVDCGEGTQMQMQRYGIHTRRIHHIFISHLHGDHYFGLIGLLTSMGLLGRTEPIYLYGPAQLWDIIQVQLGVASTFLPYPLNFTAIHQDERFTLLDTDKYAVSCFPTIHRIQCHGFVFTEKMGGRKLLPELCAEHEIPTSFYARLKQGEDYISKTGKVIKNELVTTHPLPSKRYAFCADTVYTDSFLEDIKEVDMIYHESTYLEASSDKAALRFHSTASQAANIALQANAKRLLLGHFSSRYEDLTLFENEARTVFPNTEVAYEGMSFEC